MLRIKPHILINSILFAIVCGLLSCIVAVSLWLVKTHYVVQERVEAQARDLEQKAPIQEQVKAEEPESAAKKPSLALAASTTIPYITDPKYIEYLREAIKKEGPKAVQDKLKDLYANDGPGEQHMAFHYVGEVLYEQQGAKGLPLCSFWYGFGCYHGLLLSAITTEGVAVVPSLDDACIEIFGHTMDTETCQHGIGHGLLEASGRDPVKAVKECDHVKDVFKKAGCASGVFMEYFAPAQSDKHSQEFLMPKFDPKQPYDVCMQFSGTRMGTCLFELQSWWEGVGKQKPRDVEALCNAVQDKEARNLCLFGYGAFRGPYSAPAIPYCDQFVEPESHAMCRAGIFWAASHQPDDPDPSIACNDLEGEYKEMCFKEGEYSCAVDNTCKYEH